MQVLREAESVVDERPPSRVIIGSAGNRLAVMSMPAGLPSAVAFKSSVHCGVHRLDVTRWLPCTYAVAENINIMAVNNGQAVIRSSVSGTVIPIGFSVDDALFAFVNVAHYVPLLEWMDCETGCRESLPVAGLHLLALSIGLPAGRWVDSSRLLVRVQADVSSVQQHGRTGHYIVTDFEDALPSARWRLSTTCGAEVARNAIFVTQLAVVDVKARTVLPVGLPGLFGDIWPSPDGRFVLTETLSGNLAATETTASLKKTFSVIELHREPVVGGGHITDLEQGFYATTWRPGAPATAIAIRHGTTDRVVSLSPPFTNPSTIIEGASRFTDYWWTSERQLLVLARSGVKAELVWVRDDGSTAVVWSGDHSAAPTRFVLGAQGAVLQRESSVFVLRAATSATAAQTVLESLDLRKGCQTHVWTSPWNEFEDILGGVDRFFVTRRESPVSPPRNYLLSTEGNQRFPLEAERTPSSVARARRIVVRYGHKAPLEGVVYLPTSGSRRDDAGVPTIVWIYPRLRSSRNDPARTLNRYPDSREQTEKCVPLSLTCYGYAVVHTPPLVDDPISDDIWTQVLGHLDTLIAALVNRGADRERIAVGGYSAGAGMAAMLLGRTTLFCAGILCSGCYAEVPRLLTQSLEAQQQKGRRSCSTAVSPPINLAKRMSGPVLVIHGGDDPCDIASPLESRRFASAIANAGGKARYVELLSEGHAYLTRASRLLFIQEVAAWCDKYV